MQYLVLAYDKKGVLEKRLAVRNLHVKGAREYIKKGNILQAGALIENEQMVGSTLFVEFESRVELGAWLENEIYVKQGVWDMDKIQILPIKVLPKE
ncbi:MAG: hypothetical protein KGV58_00300 [Campylobacteraceae bacterium]|nr:hypothetical protein [Campylobacteraceae bacterium]